MRFAEASYTSSYTSDCLSGVAMANGNNEGETLSEEERQIRQWDREVHQKEREVLFGNEALVITVLQALTGGAMFAALAGAERLQAILGTFPFLVFLTTVDLALFILVLTAFFKHQYKKWDVKARTEKELVEKIKRSVKSHGYLVAMRWGMLLAVCVICLALIELPAFAWLRAICTR